MPLANPGRRSLFCRSAHCLAAILEDQQRVRCRDMPTRCTCECAHVGGAYQRPCSVPGGCGSEGCDGFGNIPDDRSARDEAAPVPACLLCSRKLTRDDRVCLKCMDRVWG